MSFELLERATQALEPVLSDLVFLGGASIVLWITDPAAPSPRPTKDVDVVVEVTSRTAFHAFEDRLRSLGFEEDQDDGIIRGDPGIGGWLPGVARNLGGKPVSGCRQRGGVGRAPRGG